MPTPNKIETHGNNNPQFHHSPVSGNVRIQYILKLAQKHSKWLMTALVMFIGVIVIVVNDDITTTGHSSPVITNVDGDIELNIHGK